MAKKFKSKNKVNGIQPAAVPPVVRWLNAFAKPGINFTTEEVIGFEKVSAQTGKFLCAEAKIGSKWIVPARSKSSFGLLIDPKRTKLYRCYAVDAYSDIEGTKSSKGSCPFVTSWYQISGLLGKNKRIAKAVSNSRSWKWQTEVVYSDPTYTAVIFRNRGKVEAAKVAKALGLPLIHISEL